jgi:hypothetical protein
MWNISPPLWACLILGGLDRTVDLGSDGSWGPGSADTLDQEDRDREERATGDDVRDRPANRATVAMAKPHRISPAYSAWARNECTVARTSPLVCRFTQMVPMVRVSG